MQSCILKIQLKVSYSDKRYIELFIYMDIFNLNLQHKIEPILCFNGVIIQEVLCQKWEALVLFDAQCINFCHIAKKSTNDLNTETHSFFFSRWQSYFRGMGTHSKAELKNEQRNYVLLHVVVVVAQFTLHRADNIRIKFIWQLK